MPWLLGASLVLAGLTNLIWSALPVVGLASLVHVKYLVGHATIGLLLFTGAFLLSRRSRAWPVPVVLATIVHFVLYPEVLTWLVTGNFLSAWSFLVNTLSHDAAPFWLKFNVATFQYIIPAYLLCLILFVGWRLFRSASASRR
jgi:hypothetical protein